MTPRGIKLALAAATAVGCMAFGGALPHGGGTAHAHGGEAGADAARPTGVVEPVLTAYRADDGAAVRTTFAEESFSWQTATPHPIERFESNGLAAHGRLWVIGGFGRYTTQASPRSDAYDPATGSWTRIADMPVTVTHSPAVLVGGTIWFIGGFVGNHPGPSTKDVWRYDTSSNAWSRGPSLPVRRGAGAAAAVDGKIHFFGGGDRPAGVLAYPSETEHWALDLADQSAGWKPRADLPSARDHLAGAAVDGAVYAIGGQRGGEDTGNQRRVDRYDPATDSWRRVADMPTARGHITASTFVVNGLLIVGGGTNNGNLPSADMASYDPTSDSWAALPPLPSGRKTPVMGLIGGRLVSSTGYNGTGTRTTWVSTPIAGAEPPGPEPGDPEPEPGDPEPPPPGPGPPGTPKPPVAGPEEGGGGAAPGPGAAPAGPSPAPGARGRKISLSVAQLRINQRISQAAVRRVNALEAIVEGRPVEAPRAVVGRPARISLTVGQLRINQRISQAALRRAIALEARLDGRPAPKPSGEPSGARITLSARQLRINQRISQAALRRVNALGDRVARNGFRAAAPARHAPRPAAEATVPRG